MNILEPEIKKHLDAFMANPAALEPVVSIFEYYSRQPDINAAVEKKLCADEGFKALYDQWYKPEPFSLDDLLQLSENSFGHHYATHMKANDLDPNFIHEFENKSVLSYSWTRAAHVHDICHVITGFDTSFEGELGLKGFEMAQYHSPTTAAIIGAGFMTLTAMQPETVRPMFDAIVKGWEMGKEYPLLTGIKWDQEWQTPLAELREKYGLPAPLNN